MIEPSNCLVDLDLSSIINRLREEKNATKKHVEATKAWKKQHKEKVRAAEKQTAQYDASDLPIAGAENVEQLDLEGNPSGGADAEELPVHQQVFFPQQVQEPECSLPDGEPLLPACRAEIIKFRTVEADSLEYSVLSQELICGDWLTEHYRRSPECPEETARMLFRVSAFSRNEALAAACCSTLLALLGAPDSNCTSLATSCSSTTYVSALYGCSPSMRVTQWAPGANDVLAALTQLGYRPPQAPASGRQARNAAAKKGAELAPEDSSTEPQLLNVVLLLRIFRAVCQAKESVGGAQGPAWSDHAGLVVALMRLRMDPETCTLAGDLESALHAGLQAFGESAWQRKFSSLAEQASQVGASHKGHLEAIGRIPTQSVRGRLLRQHALLALLRHTIPSKAPPASAASSGAAKRGAVADVDIPKALQSLPWFSDMRAMRAMAASAMGCEGSFGPAEVHTALQAAHKLAWDHELLHGRDDFVTGTWLEFLKSLEAQFLTHKKLDRMSDLKLLFTALLNFTSADQV